MSVLSLSPLGVALRSEPFRSDADGFELLGPSRPRWQAFVLSVVLHAIVIAVLPALTRPSARALAEQEARRAERILHTLRIRIPEPLYLAASEPAPQHSRPPVLTAAARPKAVPAPKPAPEEGRKPVATRRFELPPLPVRAETDQSLIQPRHMAGTMPARGLTLPQMFFWAPPPPKIAVKPFVEPGYVKPPPPTMRLDAPPRLEVPRSEVAAMPVPGLPKDRSLQIAPPLAMPIQTTLSASPSSGPIVAALGEGDPINVLALSSSSMPLREYVTVPPGNQVGRTPGAVSGGSLAGTADGSGAGASGAPGVGSGASGSGTGSGPGAGDGIGADGHPPLAAVRAAISATRMLNPSNGVFDVVVQSSGLEGFAESAGILSGKPVYSVYLRVGGKREWILQYCIPASDATPAETGGRIIKLSAPKRLLAPYPLVTYRPPERRNGARFLMVHGFITAQGRFEDLRVLGGRDSWYAAVALEALSRWEFRPAILERQPARVEVLVAIPPE